MKFGHRGLDKLIEVESGIITAFVGDAASAKTTLCLALAKNAKHPFMIDTEGVSLNRIKQVGCTHLKIARVREFSKQVELLSNIAVDCDLLILDSFVMLYRLELYKSPTHINHLLAKQMSLLHRFAEDNQIPVIVTGHIYKTEKGIKLVSGDILKYWAKSILLLKKTALSRRKAIILKHRSRPEGKSASFRLCDKGIC